MADREKKRQELLDRVSKVKREKWKSVKRRKYGCQENRQHKVQETNGWCQNKTNTEVEIQWEVF